MQQKMRSEETGDYWVYGQRLHARVEQTAAIYLHLMNTLPELLIYHSFS